jgi:hypothetical protein
MSNCAVYPIYTPHATRHTRRDQRPKTAIWKLEATHYTSHTPRASTAITTCTPQTTTIRHLADARRSVLDGPLFQPLQQQVRRAAREANTIYCLLLLLLHDRGLCSLQSQAAATRSTCSLDTSLRHWLPAPQLMLPPLWRASYHYHYHYHYPTHTTFLLYTTTKGCVMCPRTIQIAPAYDATTASIARRGARGMPISLKSRSFKYCSKPTRTFAASSAGAYCDERWAIGTA